MNKNALPDYVDHMVQAARDACGFVEGLAKDEFLSDKRIQNAVVMSLMVLGEASTKVMDLHPEFLPHATRWSRGARCVACR